MNRPEPISIAVLSSPEKPLQNLSPLIPFYLSLPLQTSPRRTITAALPSAYSNPRTPAEPSSSSSRRRTPPLHQSYTHKILTGRRDMMPTMRQTNGLSGFTKRSESEYDCFGTGHSSTTISAGLGMAMGRDLKGRNNNVVAVIGDGAMTAGIDIWLGGCYSK